MRPSVLMREQRYKDILKGFPVLILAMLVLSLLKTAAINQTPEKAFAGKGVYVQIDGDIRHPGIYNFDHLPDIRELIKAGGEITSELRAVSALPVIPVHSGSKITVRGNNGEPVYVQGEISSFHKITLGLPVSVNLESEEGLAAVPAIGPKLAWEIVRERSRRGGFKTLDELRSVYGIGEKKYKIIITYITL
jgi:competence protein ComEA